MIDFTSPLRQVRNSTPLVQCITNFVTVNDCANILLAAGASPTMAQDIREVEEAVAGANGLVCNLGAIDLVDSMILAGKQANQLGIPVVLDPVAAGGTALRRELMIFNWYVFQGYGYNRIAKELNERGFRNKAGEPFKGTSIRDMLLNEKYTGTYVYNKRSSYDSMGKRNNSKLKDDSEIIRVEGAFDAIISMETFNKVRGAMESRKGRNACNQAQEVYLLSGLVKCGLCGHNLHGNRKPSNRNGSHHITYKCNNRDKNGIKVCNNKEVNKIYLERAIMHFISQMCEGENFQLIMLIKNYREKLYIIQ